MKMTKSYTLNMAGSGECSEFFADSDESAVEVASRMLATHGYDDIITGGWDADGKNDDGENCIRLLIWGSEEDAENDAGARSIAQIETVV